MPLPPAPPSPERAVSARTVLAPFVDRIIWVKAVVALFGVNVGVDLLRGQWWSALFNAVFVVAAWSLWQAMRHLERAYRDNQWASVEAGFTQLLRYVQINVIAGAIAVGLLAILIGLALVVLIVLGHQGGASGLLHGQWPAGWPTPGAQP